jgi:hypothetical protein
MPERNERPELAHARKHEYWLQLKTAYEKYQISSISLASPIARQTSGGSEGAAAEEPETQQRAFEQYIEARLDFLECCFDQSNAPLVNRGPQAHSPFREPEMTSEGTRFLSVDWAPFAGRMLLLRVLPFALLCVTAFSVILQQRHTRELEAVLETLQARIGQPLESQPPAQQARDARHGISPSVIHQDGHPLPPAQAAHKRPAVAPQVHPSQPSRTAQPTSGWPVYYEFALSPSRQFKQVGPVKVTVAAIDPKRKSARLSITSDLGTLQLQQLKQNQPVWIPIGNREKPIEFVVDQIDRTGLKGHLGEPGSGKPDLRASQRVPKSPGRPNEGTW